MLSIKARFISWQEDHYHKEGWPKKNYYNRFQFGLCKRISKESWNLQEMFL